MFRERLTAIGSAVRPYQKRAGFLVLLACTEAVLLYGLKLTSRDIQPQGRDTVSPSATVLAPAYMVKDLGMPDHCRGVFATAMAGEGGEVVGMLAMEPRGLRAFSWRRGRFTVLSEDADSAGAVAYGTNGRGIVVGEVWDNDPLYVTAAAWNKGREQRLFSDDRDGVAVAVDERGTIYGQCTENGSYFRQAFARSPDGKLTYLDKRAQRSSFIGGVNQRGEVALTLRTESDQRTTAALYRSGQIKPLPSTGDSSFAIGINGHGDVVGCVTESGVNHPALWRDGKAVALPVPKGVTGIAQAINDQGDIIGKVSSRKGDNTFEAFLIHDGKFSYLTDLVGGKPRLDRAIGIDSAGTILAEGTIADGHPRAYLLTQK